MIDENLFPFYDFSLEPFRWLFRLREPACNDRRSNPYDSYVDERQQQNVPTAFDQSSNSYKPFYRGNNGWSFFSFSSLIVTDLSRILWLLKVANMFLMLPYISYRDQIYQNTYTIRSTPGCPTRKSQYTPSIYTILCMLQLYGCWGKHSVYDAQHFRNVYMLQYNFCVLWGSTCSAIIVLL